MFLNLNLTENIMNFVFYVIVHIIMFENSPEFLHIGSELPNVI